MQHFKIDAAAAPTSLNPVTEAVKTPEGIEWLVEFLPQAAGVAVDDDKKAALRTIIEGLPEGATLATLINQIKFHEAEQLGIKPEHYDALAPLFGAFASIGQK
ncbi:MAG: hypothetical protein VB135_01590 [Burkholderia sp.]